MGDLEVKRILCHCGAGGCHSLCGLLAYVDKESGRLVKVEGNPDHPMNRGQLCADRKMVPNFPAKWLYHPDQLLHPLKRVGERGENKWQQISYDQALDEISDKIKDLMDKYGTETLAVCEGTYRSDAYWARARFLNLLGNPFNLTDPGLICGRWTVYLHFAMVGSIIRPGNILASKCVVVAGKNHAESFPVTWWATQRSKREGMEFIVLDPRFTETVRNSDIWLQIRPGTDCALFLSWINIIINEGLYVRDFVETWTNAPMLIRTDTMRILRESDLIQGGSSDKFVVWDTVSNSPGIWNPDNRTYESKNVKPALEGSYRLVDVKGVEMECKPVWQLLMDRVRPCSPEWAEGITWVPAKKIRESARKYALTKPATLIWGVGTDQIGRNATQIELCRTILRTITGNLCVNGGDNLSPSAGKYIRESLLELADKCPPEARRKQLGSDRFKLVLWPLYDLVDPIHRKVYGMPLNVGGHALMCSPALIWRTIITGKPYPIKALITWSGNPLLWAPNTKLVYKALKSPNLELHVVVEHFLTPSALLADYVLPAASKSLEVCHCSNWEDSFPDVIVGEKALQRPLGERRSDYEFWRGLASKLGFAEYFPWKSSEEVAEYRLKPYGLNLEQAAKKGLIACNDEICLEKSYERINPTTGKVRGFATPSGRVEIYSSILEKLGYDPLPHYEEPPESPISTPMLAKEYPLILDTGGRFRPLFHSEYRQFGMGLREQHPDPVMDIHTETARELGIAEGDWVWIETRRGRIKQRARVTPAIHPKVVNVQASWWFPEQTKEEPSLCGLWQSNANVLTLDRPDALDPFTGAWCNRALLCKVYKVKDST